MSLLLIGQRIGKQRLSTILKHFFLKLFEALIYDAGLAALLMMGNLSVGLKKHAVSMFEVGRLEHDQIESLISELRRVFNTLSKALVSLVVESELKSDLRNIDEGESGAEGEAQMYFDQGRSLLLALELLRVHSKVDMIKAEALRRDFIPKITWNRPK